MTEAEKHEIEIAFHQIEGVFQFLNLWAQNPYGDGIARHEPTAVIAQTYGMLAPLFQTLQSLHGGLKPAEKSFSEHVEDRAQEITEDARRRLADAEQRAATLEAAYQEKREEMLRNFASETYAEATSMFREYVRQRDGSSVVAGKRELQL